MTFSYTKKPGTYIKGNSQDNQFLEKPMEMKKIKNRIELLSLHIPKTAGTSLRNMLKEHYGEEHAVRFDISHASGRIDIENQIFSKSKLPKKIRVVHGHFYYSTAVELLELSDDVKWISWVRDPVERVISNYFYLSKRLKEELDEEARGLNILAKMQKTLLEYAHNEINRNRMFKFLDGAALEKFFFIGLYENYNEDIMELAAKLDIAVPEILQHNITGTKKEVSQDEIEEIRELNKQDIEIYEKVKQIRNIKTSGGI